MDALLQIGRILFGILFGASGLMGHLGAFSQSRGYAQSESIPLAGPAVLVSGLGVVAGGIGIWADLAALGIAVFLFFTAFFMHQGWKETDQMAPSRSSLSSRRTSGSSVPPLFSSPSSPTEASSDLC